MCFSAHASFTASALLFLAGVATIRKVKDARYYLFASIPLLFSIQQAIEGLLWLSISDPSLTWLAMLSKYAYLSFAFVLWPAWIPISVRLIEQRPTRWTCFAMNTCIVIGLLVALYLTFLIIFCGATVQPEQYHLSYNLPCSPFWLEPIAFFYALATILPFFVSRKASMQLFGIALISSYLFAWLMYPYAFVSIWCFFAAILSIVVYSGL